MSSVCKPMPKEGQFGFAMARRQSWFEELQLQRRKQHQRILISENFAELSVVNVLSEHGWASFREFLK